MNSNFSKISQSIFLFSFLGWVLMISTQTSYAQTLSIGMPVDGTEGSSDISFVVSIDSGIVNTTGSAITGSLSYGGTASNGPDYTAVGSFSIPDGANSTTVTIAVVDDVNPEPTETVTAIISLLSAGTVSPTNSSSTANIIDDDAGNTLLSIIWLVDGVEGGSDISYRIYLEGSAVNTTGSPITGVVSYPGGTATNGVDYIGPTNFTVPVGASSDTITIQVIDDLLLEPTETVIAEISAPSSGTISIQQGITFITDNEPATTVLSIGAPVDGEEGGADVSFDISIDGGVVSNTGASIEGTISLSGTATYNSDYTGVALFYIPDGASSTTVTIQVIDDLLVESTETLIATISSPSIGTIGTATATANIVDNDSTSGIDPIEIFDVSVYPNPMSSNLSLKAEHQMKRYAIVDLKGRVLSERDINAKEIQVNTEFLSAGAYFINIAFEDGTVATSKVLKE